jgi:hypothetical protein
MERAGGDSVNLAGFLTLLGVGVPVIFLQGKALIQLGSVLAEVRRLRDDMTTVCNRVRDLELQIAKGA